MWKIQIGNPVSRTLRFYYKGSVAPYDLTGIIVLYTFKRPDDRARNDNQAVIKGTITEHSNSAAGLSLLEIADTVTTKLKPGMYKVDFRIIGENVKRNTFTKEIFAEQVVTEREL